LLETFIMINRITISKIKMTSSLVLVVVAVKFYQFSIQELTMMSNVYHENATIFHIFISMNRLGDHLENSSQSKARTAPWCHV